MIRVLADAENAANHRIIPNRNFTTFYLGSVIADGVTYRNTGFSSRIDYGYGIVQEFNPDARNRIE